MHKMELGDSVYAAERIMKKRIRKVSLFLLRKRTQHYIQRLRNSHPRSHITSLMYLVRFIVNRRFATNAYPLRLHQNNFDENAL